MGRNLIIPGGTRIIDATGKLVMPGGIDPHTHFELEMMGAKSADDFYKGTRAAVAGGTTTVSKYNYDWYYKKLRNPLCYFTRNYVNKRRFYNTKWNNPYMYSYRVTI